MFITLEDSRYGFNLAGFQQLVADEDNIVVEFEKIARGSESGLVFIDERLLTEEILGRLQPLEKNWGGAIISMPAPGKGEDGAGTDFGERFVARVLGYRMKLS